MLHLTRACGACGGTGRIEVKGPDYWLTPEGCAELRDTFMGDTGNCVLPLLDALEALETRLDEISGDRGDGGR